MSARRMVTVTIPEDVYEVVAHHLNGERDDLYDLVSVLLNELLDGDNTLDDDNEDFDAAVLLGDAEFRYRAVTLRQLQRDLLVLSTPIISGTEEYVVAASEKGGAA